MLSDGTLLWVIGPDVEAESVLWRNVEDAEGTEGYVNSGLLVATQLPLADQTSSPPPEVEEAGSAAEPL